MPDIHLEDTIAAIATPLGEGGISVIRLSGPESFAILEKIFRFKTLRAGKLCDFLPPRFTSDIFTTPPGKPSTRFS